MKRVAVAAALLCAVCGYAQTRYDGYELGFSDVMDDYAPEVETDTALFYHAVHHTGDLYARMAGRRLSFVENRRRNVAYRQREAVYAGAALPARYARQLRALGAGDAQSAPPAAASPFAAAAGSETYEFARTYADRPSSAGMTFSDRGYSAGIRASASAQLRHGWSIGAAADARTGRDLHADGVFTNAAGIALRVAKETGRGGEFSLTVMAEPSMRGLRTSSSAEAFALTGDNLYNPSWGWQNGRQRNSRVRREMTPLAVLSFTGSVSTSTSLTATLAAEAGTRRQSALGWYDASTPMPDNYRYMPSYFTGAESAAAVGDAWRRGDTRYTQIDWEELYRVNRMSDRGAVYALDDRVRKITDLQAAVSASTRIGNGITVSYGAGARYAADRRYRQMRDLLGAEYLTDIDYYLIDDDTYSNSLQNDLRNPGRKIAEGDRFGYDYALVRRAAALHAAAGYASGRLTLSIAGRLGGETIHRRGYYEKELFPGSGSYGRSETMRMATYAATAEAGWAFTPQYGIGASLSASAEAPDAEELFLNPQYNNRTAGSPQTVRRLAAQIDGRIRTAAVTAQASLFAESQRGGIMTMQYYDDLAAEYCDMTVSGIDIMTYGIEAAAAIRLTRRWNIDVSVTALRCLYASDPTVRIWSDSSNTPVDTGSASHMGGCVPGGVPRIAASLAAGYRPGRGWSIALSAAWAGARCVDPSFLRRTERVAYQGSSSPESFAAIVRQERLPDAFDVGLYVSKRWFVGHGSRITAMLSVHNLTGERNTVYSAWESHRLRRTTRGIQSDYTPLPTRYLYAYPRTVTLSVSYTF